MHSKSALNLRYIAGDIYTTSHSSNISMIDNSNALLLLSSILSSPLAEILELLLEEEYFRLGLRRNLRSQRRNKRFTAWYGEACMHRPFSKSIQNVEKNE